MTAEYLPRVFKTAVRQETLVKIAVRQLFIENTICRVILKTAVIRLYQAEGVCQVTVQVQLCRFFFRFFLRLRRDFL